jgi:uncharacterized protein (TIGR02145 family)
MRKCTFLCLLIFVVATLQAQDYLISFEGTGAAVAVDSVQVENLTQSTSLTVYNGNQLQLLGTVSVAGPGSINNVRPLMVSPNPSDGEVLVTFEATATARSIIELCDLTGRQVVNAASFFERGLQSFSICGMKKGTYLICVRSEYYNYYGKIICRSTSEKSMQIKMQGQVTAPPAPENLKQTSAIVVMQCNTGDLIKFTGKSGIYATVYMAAPTASQTITFSFVDCTDWDNNHYAVVQINEQLWMAENLKTTTFNDGQSIPYVTNNAAWGNLTSPGFCWGNNNPANKDEYGGLYNWFAVNTGKLAPTGWRVPTVDEFFALRDYLGGESIAGGKMKSTTKWFAPNTGGTNESGFSSFPVDYRNYDGFIFWDPGSMSSFWSSTGVDNLNAYGSRLAHDRAEFNIWDSGANKKYGYSIRCIHD